MFLRLVADYVDQYKNSQSTDLPQTLLPSQNELEKFCAKFSAYDSVFCEFCKNKKSDSTIPKNLPLSKS